MNKTVLPKELREEFRAYSPVIEDHKVVYAWGFKPFGQLSEEEWSLAATCGTWHCHEMGGWSLVVKWQTIAGLVKALGKPRAVVVGPRGGYRFAVYGETEVYDKRFDPRGKYAVPEWLPEQWKEIEQRLTSKVSKQEQANVHD